jgi:hypothetical protein
MSFNANYILPGDDKNQILGKVNYNFSQILANAVGLPGEIGTKGPTGIIGQVGKDGATGATGTRANLWFIQEDQPFGNIPYTETPLIDYDIWVNTSPTGPSGPNRIYRYSSSNTSGYYPFWVDTLSNFAIDAEFTLLQGIYGPGEVTEDDAIIISPNSGTGPLNTTFVFSDRKVTDADANPNYAKVLVETDASVTASLPIFGLDKTFYSSSALPAFYWKTTGLDYGIRFSTGEDFIIQSQATGSYGSTGGTAAVSANNINVTSSTTLSLSSSNGISLGAQTLGFSSRNSTLGPAGLALTAMTSSLGITAASTGYSLSITGTLAADQTGERTVFNYVGFYGGTRRNSLNLSMSDSTLFAVGNPPPAATIDATAASLVIGYTGSTGVSGGTGANIVKSYQSITDPASSRILVGSNLNNSIEITPSNDVIVITPTPTGPIISDGSRINRIWLSISNPNSYLEPGNDTCIDIFMNSSTYCIGGVSVTTNDFFFPSVYTISDSGQTSPGATGGCRHVRINFYGSEFPSAVNPSRDKFFYLEAFSSGYSSAVQLPYYYAVPSSFNATVICTELHRQGFMPDEIREADERFGRMISATSPETMLGYHYWAIPIVNLMQKSRLFTRIVWAVARPWAYHMAYEMGSFEKDNLLGKILMKVGGFVSRVIGKSISSRNSRKSNQFANF